MAGLAGLDVLERDGVDPACVTMSHCDERAGSDFALAVGRRGAFVSCDTFGMGQWAKGFNANEPMPTDEERLRIVEDVLAAGYLKQLLLSQDVCQQTQLLRHGGFGYGHLDRTIVPQLLALGVTSSDLNQIRVSNPAASLSVSQTALVGVHSS
jgi:phosphotriesterase-related protein